MVRQRHSPQVRGKGFPADEGALEGTLEDQQREALDGVEEAAVLREQARGEGGDVGCRRDEMGGGGEGGGL